uniref:Uncharacterized protein n=1 Tax=Anguilla anguilla TaxID=7936 RepID=A0A0E9VSY3_ANGAN
MKLWPSSKFLCNSCFCSCVCFQELCKHFCSQLTLLLIFTIFYKGWELARGC